MMLTMAGVPPATDYMWKVTLVTEISSRQTSLTCHSIVGIVSKETCAASVGH